MSDTPFDIAQARNKHREHLSELEQMRKQQKALLLNGTSDLFKAVHLYESELIKFALRASNKSVTKAANLLGVSYQWLIFAIESRHSELASERSPVHRRRAG